MPRAEYPQVMGMRIPDDLKAAAREVAVSEGRTLASYIRWLIIQDLRAREAAELAAARRGGGWLDKPPSETSTGAAGDGAGANDDRVGDRRAES